ncbi:MAG: transporter [Candidatus Omnitrophica bacterium]|nr:transporter [Candidatus Omnitrophota bacterium]
MNSNGRGQLIFAVAVGAVVALMGQLPMQRKLQNLEQEVSQLRQQIAQQSIAAHEIPVRMAGFFNTADGSLPSLSSPSSPLRVAQATPASYEDGAQVMSERELDAIFAGAGVVGPGPAASAAAAAALASGETEGAATRLIPRVDRGGVLLPKGRLQVEPTISYSHLSSNRVGLSGFSVFDVIFIGEIRSDEINRDIVTSSVNTRYGVTNNLEVELDVPTQFQYEEVLSGPIENREQSIQSRGGLNDISAAMFYQFVREHGAMPSLIANMKLRAPTGQAPKLGSGTWGVKGGLTMVKTSDPVALFSNVGYSLNLPGTVNGLSIDPGDSFEYSAGLAYALNYHLAVNGGFEQIFIGESKSGGGSIKGSRLVISNLKAGINYALTKNLSLDFSVGAGLTEDSPDVTVTFSLPYTF